MNKKIDKKELLFHIRNYIQYISYDDMQEILLNVISYNFDNNKDLIIKFKKNYRIIITTDGRQYWNNSRGEIHRDNNKPAIIWPDGHKAWYRQGYRVKDDLHI